MKLKANSLFIVIVLSLVIGLLCSALVLMAYFSKVQITRNLIQQQLIANVESGLVLLSLNNDASYNSPVLIDLHKEERDSVLLQKKEWGIFEVGSVTAFFKGDTCKKTFLLGYKPDKISKSAIWLTENYRPLSLAGNTSIKGDCYLPESGISRVYIEGKGSFVKQLVEGKISKSSPQLPELNEKIKSAVIESLNGQFSNVATQEFGQSFQASEALYRGFDKTPVCLTSSDSALTISQEIRGNVIIAAKGKVIITNRARLHDIRVYANSVVVESGFKGCLQIFAKDSIVLQKDARLSYPSVLGLIKLVVKEFQPFIRLQKNSAMSGLIIMDQEMMDRMKVRLDIETDAILLGQAYVNGFADIKGKLYGNIICDKFLLKTPSSIYENHLMDAIIDRTKLPASFVGSAILPSKSRKEVVKWF